MGPKGDKRPGSLLSGSAAPSQLSHTTADLVVEEGAALGLDAMAAASGGLAALWESFEQALHVKAVDGFTLPYTVAHSLAFSQVPITIQHYSRDTAEFVVDEQEMEEPTPGRKDACCTDRAKEVEFQRAWFAGSDAVEKGLSEVTEGQATRIPAESSINPDSPKGRVGDATR